MSVFRCLVTRIQSLISSPTKLWSRPSKQLSRSFRWWTQKVPAWVEYSNYSHACITCSHGSVRVLWGWPSKSMGQGTKLWPSAYPKPLNQSPHNLKKTWLHRWHLPPKNLGLIRAGFFLPIYVKYTPSSFECLLHFFGFFRSLIGETVGRILTLNTSYDGDAGLYCVPLCLSMSVCMYVWVSVCVVGSGVSGVGNQDRHHQVSVALLLHVRRHLGLQGSSKVSFFWTLQKNFCSLLLLICCIDPVNSNLLMVIVIVKDNVYGAVIIAVHCHCESSPGSSDECSMLRQVAANLWTKPISLSQ